MKDSFETLFNMKVPPEYYERLLTKEEVAKLLGIKPNTLYSLVYQGKIGSVNMGRALRFTLKHVEEFIKNNLRQRNEIWDS